MNFPKDEVDVIIYHNPCNDGFASAYIAHMYYKLMQNNRSIDFVGANYSDVWPQQQTAGKNVLIADFSYPLTVMQNALNITSDKQPKQVIIIDHHKTAQSGLESLNHEKVEKIFNMNRSGCGLVWEFFFGAAPMPLFLRMIEDNDLWKHSIEGTKPLIAYLRINQISFELFDALQDEKFLREAILKGESYLEYENSLIEKASKRAVIKLVQFKNTNRKIYSLVAHAEAAEFKSELGNKLVRDYPATDFSVVMQYNPYSNLTFCSLRSSETGVDVSEISKDFLGGGGHRNASGATIKNAVTCISHKSYDVPNIYKVLLEAKFHSVNYQDRNFCICCVVAPSMQTQHPLGMYLLQKRYSEACKSTQENQPTEINNASHLFALQSNDLTQNCNVRIVSVVVLNEFRELISNIYFDSRFVSKTDILEGYLAATQWKEVEQASDTFKSPNLGYVQLIKCVKPVEL